MTSDIDKQIADVFALLAVLLAFEFGYLAYMLSVIGAAVAGMKPELDEATWAAAAGRVAFYRNALAAMAISLLAILGVVSRLTWLVLTNWKWPWEADYITVRAGLILVDLFLLATLAVAVVQANRVHGALRERRAQRRGLVAAHSVAKASIES